MPHLSTSRTRGLLAGGLLLLGGSTAAVAVAATPGNGEVSKANPKVTWSGEVTNSYANRLALLLADIAGASDNVPCAPQTCDSFALKVAESDDLTITADAPESTSQTGDAGSQVTLRITKPDGSKELHTTETAGASPDKPLTVKFKKAPAGDYTIEYYNYFYGSAIPYSASATLGAVQAAKPAAPGTTPTGPGTTQPGQQPSQQQPSQPPAQESLSVTAKAGKLSAKKLNKAKKLGATITVSRAVSSATATLKSGSKIVGKGKLGAFSGSKKISLKLSKKLKAGKYTLVVAATDGKGTTAGKSIALKVKK